MQEIIPIHDELMKLQHDMSTKMINFDVPFYNFVAGIPCISQLRFNHYDLVMQI